MIEGPNRADTLQAAMAGFGRLLPGDKIHDVAPINKDSAPTAVRIANIDAAKAKRARKAQRRAARG